MEKPSRSALGAFQSAPLTEARGDSPASTARASDAGFNPLPSPKRGEMRFSPDGHCGHEVSIRSPHRSEGRSQAAGGLLRRRLRVSIRSPHRSEGRSPSRASIATSIHSAFQSAPLTEARGDRFLLRPRTLLVVSIRSPHRSEGRYHGIGSRLDVEFVSIRSPHRSEGR